MLTLEVTNKQGVFQLNLPTSIEELTEDYISQVTSHIKIDTNYTLIGVVFREKLSTLVLAARKNKKNSDIPVIPIFVKAGETNSKLINSLKIGDKLLISASDIMIGHHVFAPNNLITINTILDLLDGDMKIYNQLIASQEMCYFIEFKLVPNCNIHGAYIKDDKSSFISPFVTKISDNKSNNIIAPNRPEIII